VVEERGKRGGERRRRIIYIYIFPPLRRYAVTLFVNLLILNEKSGSEA